MSRPRSGSIFWEVGLSAVFRVVQVTAIDRSAGTYVVYELVFQANTLFTPQQCKTADYLERVLNWVLVTPRCTVSTIRRYAMRPTRITPSCSRDGIDCIAPSAWTFRNQPSSSEFPAIRSRPTTAFGMCASCRSNDNDNTGAILAIQPFTSGPVPASQRVNGLPTDHDGSIA
jgi:hypothetical protein